MSSIRTLDDVVDALSSKTFNENNMLDCIEVLEEKGLKLVDVYKNNYDTMYEMIEEIYGKDWG